VIDRDPHTLAHAHGPDTAHEAARGNQRGKAIHRVLVLRCFAQYGQLTTYAAWLRMRSAGLDLTEVRRRSTDLLNAGLIAETGIKAPLPTGRRANTYLITKAGRDVLAALREDS
jgi:hypothetical protein